MRSILSVHRTVLTRTRYVFLIHIQSIKCHRSSPNVEDSKLGDDIRVLFLFLFFNTSFLFISRRFCDRTDVNRFRSDDKSRS